jgi:hypothetical protein
MVHHRDAVPDAALAAARVAGDPRRRLGHRQRLRRGDVKLEHRHLHVHVERGGVEFVEEVIHQVGAHQAKRHGVGRALVERADRRGRKHGRRLWPRHGVGHVVLLGVLLVEEVLVLVVVVVVVVVVRLLLMLLLLLRLPAGRKISILLRVQQRRGRCGGRV